MLSVSSTGKRCAASEMRFTQRMRRLTFWAATSVGPGTLADTRVRPKA